MDHSGINNGRMIWYLFNEQSGTVVRDITGNPALNCSLNNMAFTGKTSNWVGTPSGGALHFDGTNDYGDMGTYIQSFMDYNKPFTISINFFITAHAATFSCLWGMVTQRGAAFNDIEIRFHSTGYIEAIFNHAPATNVVDGYAWRADAVSVSVGKYYNFVWSYDGSNTVGGGKVYVNGLNKTNTTTNNGAITSTFWESGQLLDKDIWLGGRNFGSGDMPFNGIIDSFSAWNRVLSPLEIQLLANNQFIGIMPNKARTLNPTLYGLGAWNGKLIGSGATGTLTADSVNNTVEAGMAISLKKA